MASEDEFYADIRSADGTYKFLVDGQWRHADDQVCPLLSLCVFRSLSRNAFCTSLCLSVFVPFFSRVCVLCCAMRECVSALVSARAGVRSIYYLAAHRTACACHYIPGPHPERQIQKEPVCRKGHTQSCPF